MWRSFEPHWKEWILGATELFKVFLTSNLAFREFSRKALKIGSILSFWVFSLKWSMFISFE
jgi:hypothetical protein